ncbi:uncharacterized protein G2W53_022813 [Senna tora]|uniref:Uncharacterized protein n=1 Tax=Senna tora TaxID=362788 RepID=A0A834TUZ3_9FABA|nr:uncharacterized protein G2W53_022813 [Senna tora]
MVNTLTVNHVDHRAYAPMRITTSHHNQ